MSLNNKLAIVAGNGELTTLLAKSAREQGFNTCLNRCKIVYNISDYVASS